MAEVTDGLKNLIRGIYEKENPEKAKRLNDDVINGIITTYNGDHRQITKAIYDKENPEKAQRINEDVYSNIEKTYGLGSTQPTVQPQTQELVQAPGQGEDLTYIEKRLRDNGLLEGQPNGERETSYIPEVTGQGNQLIESVKATRPDLSVNHPEYFAPKVSDSYKSEEPVVLPQGKGDRFEAIDQTQFENEIGGAKIDQTQKEEDTGLWNTWLGDAAQGFAGTTVDIGGNIAALSNIPFRSALNSYAKNNGMDNETRQLFVDSFLANNPVTGVNENLKISAKQAAQKLSEQSDRYDGKDFVKLWKDGDYTASLGDVFLQGAKSLPYMITAMAGGSAGLGFIGATSGAGKYEELDGIKKPSINSSPDEMRSYLSRVNMNEFQKLTNATLTGTSEALSEYLGSVPFGKYVSGLVGKFGGKVAKEKLQGGISAWSKKMFEKYGLLLGPVGEGLEEFSNTVATNTIDWATGARPDFNPLENSGKSFIYGIGGGAYGSAVAAPFALQNKLSGNNQVPQQAEQPQENITQQPVSPDAQQQFTVSPRQTKEAEIRQMADQIKTKDTGTIKIVEIANPEGTDNSHAYVVATHIGLDGKAVYRTIDDNGVQGWATEKSISGEPQEIDVESFVAQNLGAYDQQEQANTLAQQNQMMYQGQLIERIGENIWQDENYNRIQLPEEEYQAWVQAKEVDPNSNPDIVTQQYGKTKVTGTKNEDGSILISQPATAQQAEALKAEVEESTGGNATVQAQLVDSQDTTAPQQFQLSIVPVQAQSNESAQIQPENLQSVTTTPSQDNGLKEEPTERKITPQTFGKTQIDIIEGEEFDEVVPNEKVTLEKALPILEKEFKDNEDYQVVSERVQVEIPAENKYKKPTYETVIKSIKIVPKEVIARQKQADTNTLLDIVDEFNSTPQNREDKQKASEIQAIAKQLGYQTERNASNQIRLFDNSGTISRQQVSENVNNSETQPEKVAESQQQSTDDLVNSLFSNENSSQNNQQNEKPVENVAEKIADIEKRRKEELNQNGNAIKIWNNVEFYEDSEGNRYGLTYNKNGKLTLRAADENNRIVGEVINTYDSSVSVSDMIDNPVKYMDESYSEYNTRTNPKGKLDLEQKINAKYDAELNAINNEKPAMQTPESMPESGTNQREDTPQAQQGEGNEEGLEENVNIPTYGKTVETKIGSIDLVVEPNLQSDNPNSLKITAYNSDGRTIGFSSSVIDPTNKTLTIKVSQVKEPYQRKGVYSKIVDEFELIANERGLTLEREKDAETNDSKEFWNKRIISADQPVGESLTADPVAEQPKVKQQAKKSNSITGKAKEIEVSESDIQGLALQYFINGGMVKSDEILRMFKDSSKERSDRFSYTSNDNGQTVNQIAHDIWQALPENIQNGLAEMDVYNAVENAIKENSSAIAMAKKQLKRYSLDPNQGFSEEWLNNQLKIEEEERLTELEIWTNDLAELEINGQLPTESELIELFLPENTDNGKQEINQREGVGSNRPINPEGNGQNRENLQGSEPGVQGEVKSEVGVKKQITIPKGSRIVDKRNPTEERFFESVDGDVVTVATIFSSGGKKRQGEIDVPLDEFLENFIEVTESGYKKIRSQVNDYEKAQPIKLGGLTEKEQAQKESDLLNIVESNKKQEPKKPLNEFLSDSKKEVQEKKQDKPSPAYGENNKIVSKERAEELRKRLRDKLNNLNAGFDPEVLAIGTELAAYHIEAGARKFADFSKAMIDDIGEAIKPYLKSIYNGARDLPGMEELENEMTEYAEVKKANIDEILKPQQEVSNNPFVEKVKDGTINPSDVYEIEFKNFAGTTFKEAVSFIEYDGTLISFINVQDDKKGALMPKDILESGKLEFKEGNKKAFVASIKSKLGTEKLNIVSIRKIAAENGFVDIKDTTLQEYVELAIISKARDIVSQNISQDEKYKQIVDLYNSQPTISMRSSERIEKQQYSTPIPMSFLAGEFVNAINPKLLLEPSSGNGMMVFNVDPNIVIANEIDQVRLENLSEQGFKMVTEQDGTTEFYIPKVDAVVTNPPFGKSDARDYKGYKISGLDEQMVVNALENLSENGRASIIIGGHTKYKSNGTLAGEKAFFNYLYNFYNVSDVINMDGGLYSKQGTSYPTRLILINGLRNSNQRVYAPLEKNTNTDIVTTFDELQNRVNKASNEKTILQPEVPERNSNGTGSRSGNGRISITERTGTLDFGGTNTSSNQPGNGQVSNDRPTNKQEGTPKPNDGNGRNSDVIDGSQRNDDSGNRGNNGGIQPKDTSKLLDRSDELVGDKVEIDLTKEKTPYPARSKADQIGSVVPTNVAQTLADVLSVFKDIDEYVQIKLGYNSKDELFNALAAEQIDSVAMAIYQIENGGALIIGDMTGVGKGRQAAAILRYAHNQGKKPIFVTEKAHLFSDIYRDLRDIGSADLRPLIFNSKSQNSDPTIVDETGTVIYSPLSEAVKKPIFNSGVMPSQYDYAVLTYSQLNAGVGKVSAKKDFFSSILEDNILVLDESHNAGGEGNTGTFMTNALPATKGVVFLSGTFAKRADNMPIYALKTSMSDANMSNAELIEAIKTGGVPLQEIMSKNLTQSGQMIRRERDFTGVSIDWKTIEDASTHFKAYDSIIKVFNDLIQFQREYIDPIIDEKNEELAAMQAGAEHTAGTSDFGINNVPFASKTFNLTRQLLFSLKAKNIADEAIAELKAGRRPVIAVANTMEGFMNELGGIGEKISNYDFSTTLMKGLHGLFRFTETDGMGEHQNLVLTVDDLPKDAKDRYYEIEDFIKNMSVGISISPIDVIKDAIQKAGYSIGEMTGRSNELIFNTDGTAAIQKRTNTDKKKLTRDFNAGKIDALIMNQSASTGISLHASSKVADQRQRIMLSAQTQLDVNTEVQMRGRIDRTGQVIRGAYRYILSPIPAEQRMTMMFKVKLKSLDANTTSSQKSKTNEIEIVDFLNKYGDKICVDHLKEDSELNEKLLDPMKFEGKSEADIESFVAPEGAALKIAGRVALLPINEQQKFYDEITEKYNTLINYLNDTNSNDLEITTLPLRAETKEKVVVAQGKGGNNPFAKDSYRETVEIDVLKKPLKAEEVRNEIKKFTGGLDQKEYRDQLIEKLDSYTENIIETEVKKSNEDYNSKEKSRIDKAKKIFFKQNIDDKNVLDQMLEEYLNASQNIHDTSIVTKTDRIRRKTDGIRRVFNMFPVGKVIMIPNTSDISTHTSYSEGVLMGYKLGNKMNPSTITAVFATLDSRRKIEVPLSKIDFLNASYAQTMQMRFNINTTLDNWDEKIPTRNRRTGYIITGNILQAFAGNEGQLIAYTDIEGNIKEGILLPENYKPNEQQMRIQIIKKLDDIRNGKPFTDITGNVRIGRNGTGGYSMDVPLSKQSGGMYFLDEGLRDLIIGRDFRQMGGRMVGAITEGNLEKVLQYMSGKFNTSVNVEIEKTSKPKEVQTKSESIPDKSIPLVDYLSNAKNEVSGKDQNSNVAEVSGTKLMPVEEFTHTQTGQILYNVKINGRRDDYDEMVTVAKKYSPYGGSRPWNKYSKGFLFNTKEDAIRFKNEVEGNEIKNSIKPIEESEESTQWVIDEMESTAKVKDDVVLATVPEMVSYMESVGVIEEEIEQVRKNPYQAGIMVNDKIMLNSSMNPAQTLLTWAHEKAHRQIYRKFPKLRDRVLFLNDLFERIGADEVNSFLPVEYKYESSQTKAQEYVTHMIEDYIVKGKLSDSVKPEIKTFIFEILNGFTTPKNIQDAKQNINLAQQKSKERNAHDGTDGRSGLQKTSGDSGIGQATDSGSLRQDDSGEGKVDKSIPLLDFLSKAKTTVSDTMYSKVSESVGNPNTILIDGVSRPTLNSKGLPIANSEEGIRNFYKWFGDSKVVDSEGRPLVVYHATSSDFDEFIPSKKGVMGKGIYTANDPNNLEGFTPDYTTASILPIYLKIENPKTVNTRDEDTQMLGNSLLYQKRKGIDTFDGVINQYGHWMPLEPSQIKSATGNNGSFDPTNNNILREPDSEYSSTNNNFKKTVPLNHFLANASKNNKKKFVKDGAKMPDSVNSDVDKNMKSAHGLRGESILDKLKRWGGKVREQARHFEHIREADYPAVYNKLRILESIPDIVKKEAYDKISTIIRPIVKTKNYYEAFERFVVLNDLMSDINKGLYDGKDLPWGYNTQDEVRQDAINMKKYVNENPDVKKVIEERNAMMRSIRDQLIKAKLLDPKAKDSEAYFHHQVLQFMESKPKNFPGLSISDARVKNIGAQKGRVGSAKAYNTNYIEAEFEVIAQTLEQLETRHILDRISDDVNIFPDIFEQAQNEGENWKSLIPEGYVKWYPKKGTNAYKAASFAEKALTNALESPENVETVLEMTAEANNSMWVIPADLAKQLDSMKVFEKENPISQVFKGLTTGWKQYILFNPYRAAKYIVNNLSGDIDIVLAYDPRVLKYVPDAVRELYANAKGSEMSADIQAALHNRVIGSGVTVNEIQDINKEGVLKMIQGSDYNLIRKYFSAAMGANNFRENTLRLAAYKYFKDKVNSGKNVYGASKKKSIDAIVDKEEKAGRLAVDLLGDYGNISQAGVWMREHVFPFWSWVEVNSPRYYHLLRNTRFEDGKTLAAVGARKTGINVVKYGLKASIVMALIVLWNRAFFPDEDDEISQTMNDGKLYLILGRTDEGDIRMLKVTGSLSDMLSYAGLDNVVNDVNNISKGKSSIGREAKEAGKAIVNKFTQGAMPLEKTAVESIIGKSMYPDIFQPRQIRDAGEHISRVVSMDKVYKLLTNKPMKGLSKEMQSLLLYNASPGEAAYYAVREKVYDFLDEKGIERLSGEPTKKSNTLYYYKQALKYGDEELAKDWLKKYYDLGGTEEGMRRSIDKGEVLSPIPTRFRDEFIKTLDKDDIELINISSKWYDNTYK